MRTATSRALSCNIRLHIAFDGDLCETAFLMVAVVKNQGPLENQWETEIRVVVSNVIASSE